MLKKHFVAQRCGLFSSVSRKVIPNNTTPIFKKWVGKRNPSHFVDGIRTSHGIV